LNLTVHRHSPSIRSARSGSPVTCTRHQGQDQPSIRESCLAKTRVIGDGRLRPSADGSTACGKNGRKRPRTSKWTSSKRGNGQMPQPERRQRVRSFGQFSLLCKVNTLLFSISHVSHVLGFLCDVGTPLSLPSFRSWPVPSPIHRLSQGMSGRWEPAESDTGRWV
jgi:hypothetical protein